MYLNPMNTNVLTGVITFFAWSIFSTWYYVNFIKDFDKPVAAEVVEPPVTKEAPREGLSTSPSADSLTTSLAPALLEVSRQFTFHRNSVELIEADALRQFADSLKEVLQNRATAVSITGHACDLGTAAHNLALGEKRAAFVAGELKSTGLQLSSIETDSKGEAEPALPNTSEENRTKNRRVTITIKSQL